MLLVAKILTGLVAALHFYIAWFEIFAWETRGPRIFSTLPAELFEPTTALAANQGIYNAFLAAGLVWALLIADRQWARNVAVCFLLFVGIAGVFGAVTVSPMIAAVQTLPAGLALTFWLASAKR